MDKQRDALKIYFTSLVYHRKLFSLFIHQHERVHRYNKKTSTLSKEIKDALKTKGKLQGMNDYYKKKLLKRIYENLEEKGKKITALRSRETLNLILCKHYYLFCGGFLNN